MLEVVNERKRQKAEDAAAKQRVRDQINRDKVGCRLTNWAMWTVLQERRRQEREGVSAEEVAEPAPTPVAAHKPAPVDHNKARIQVGLFLNSFGVTRILEVRKITFRLQLAHIMKPVQIRQIQTVKKCAPLVHEFSGDETLAAVRLYIEMHRSDGGGRLEGVGLLWFGGFS